MKNLFFLLCFFVLCSVSSASFAAETIKDFHADIQAQTDGSVLVIERITVHSDGLQIKRGISRSLPKTKGVKYSVLSVKRDGKKEPYSVSNCSKRFFTINIGNENYLPHNGVYKYEIKYTASNAILGFKDHDEIYWNVTGNDWNFPIERASAFVSPPAGASILRYAGYFGEKKDRINSFYDPEQKIFSTPRPLKKGEGLTVSVGFEKGFVDLTHEPSVTERYAVYAAMLLFSYLALTWFWFGRDPKEDVIVPRFRGPSDLTPALAGWIYSYGHNKENCLAAALLQGGLSGFLQIKYNDGLLKVTKARKAQTGEEKTFERYMTFPLVVVDKYSAKLERFMMDFSDFLEQKAGEKYFTSNTTFVFLGAILTLALTTGLCFFAERPFLSVILGFYLIAFIPLGKRCLKGLVTKRIPYVSFGTLILLAFNFFASTYEEIFEYPDVKIAILFYFLSIIALIFYSYAIIRPTYEGMRIIAHLDGIKMFLDAVGPTLPKDIDFDKMEALLPYAFLLGLEKEWEAKMKRMTGNTYQPAWFDGRFSTNRFSYLKTTLLKAGSPRPVRSGIGRFGCVGGGFGGGGGGGR